MASKARFGMFVLLALIALQSPVALWAANTPVSVVYSSISTPSSLIWISKELGFYEKYGLETNVLYATGRLPTQTLVSGQVQFVSTAASASIPAIVGGADLVILAGASNSSTLEIFSKPQITRPEQLRGKKVGITSFGSSTDTAMRFALAKWGINAGDVTLLQLGGCGEILAALVQGGVDAGICSDPTTIAAQKAGFHRLARMRDLGLNVQQAAITAQRSYVQAHPDVTDRFLRAFGEAIRYFHSNKKGALKIMSRYMRKLDADTLDKSYENYLTVVPKVPYPSMEGIQFILDELAKKIPQARKSKAQNLVDTSFIEKLEQEGFFSAR